MSRSDYSPDLAAALDRFEAPSPREGLAGRIVAAAMTPQARLPVPRDRRGGWQLARRVMIGTMAAGALSAAAVASGLLGAAGIRVPVLTAMLAPEPAPKSKPVIVRKPPVRTAEKPVTHIAEPEVAPLADPGSIAPRIDPGARLAAQVERRVERRAFIAANPELVPALKQAVSREVQFARDNPEVRALRRIPPGPERRAFLAERPELQAALRARQQDRRAFLTENPEVMGYLRAQAAKRRAARADRQGTPEEIVSAGEGNAIDAR